MARRSAENAIDWDAIERQYRLGAKSNKELAAEFEVSASSIGRRATKLGWVVDKAKEVEATTNSLLIQNASGNANPNATPTPGEIKVAAQVAADIILSHRVDIKRGRKLLQKFLDEVEALTDNRDLFELLGELLDESGPDSNGTWRKDKQNEIYMKVISLTGRSDTAKKVVEMLEKLVKLERQAFGIADGDGDKGGVEDMLANIGAKLKAQGANV